MGESPSSSPPRPQPADRPETHSIGSVIDWPAAAAKLKRTGTSGEYHGPCPVQNEGKDCFWVNADKHRIGCRRCGDGSGRLDPDGFRAHLEALGVWRERQPRAKPREKWERVEGWVFTTADGREREMVRWRKPDRKTTKRWSKPKSGAQRKPPRPADLLYFPAGEMPAGPVLLTEGASDADAAAARGCAAVGRPGAKPSRQSLERLDDKREYWITPDCDKAGAEQATTWYWAMRAVNRNARIVSMEVLRPADAKKGWDLRDFVASVPAGESVIDRMRPHLKSEPSAHDAPEDAVGERRPIEKGIAGVVEALGELGIEVRYNLLNGREEFRNSERDEWAPRVDEWESYTRALIEERFEYLTDGDAPPKPALMSRELFGTGVEKLAWGHRENPALTWLEQLPAWDRTPRLDNWMNLIWDCGRNPEQLLAWACRAPLLAAVQRQTDPGTKHDEIVILLGDQGIGKSSVLRALTPCPDKWFSDGLNLGNDDKARIESLLGHVVIEISDMQGLRRMPSGDVENLKAFLSRREDSVRLAYRRNPEVFPRMAVIYGTANNHDCLLYDESGVRRFVVMEIGRGVSVAEAVEWVETNRDQLWAEAWARRAEKSFLPAELVQVNERHSGAHQPEDEAGEAMVQAVIADAAGEPFSIPDVLERILAEGAVEKRREWLTMRGMKRLGTLLRRHGFEKAQVSIAGGKRPRRWQRVDAQGNPTRAVVRDASFVEEATTDENNGPPTCIVCGRVFLVGEDGITNLCREHAGGGQ